MNKNTRNIGSGAMNLIYKKTLAIIVSCILILFTNLSAQAASLGTLSYWYSDSTTIERWDTHSLTVRAVKLDTLAVFSFNVSLTHACDQWKVPLGLSLYVTSSTSAPISYYGGTRQALNNLSIFPTIYSGVNGGTINTSYQEGTYSYGATTKTGNVITSSIGYIVDNNRTNNEYKETCTHELGHALGWYGHSSNWNSIMYAYGSSLTTLTYIDKNHLAQVY